MQHNCHLFLGKAAFPGRNSPAFQLPRRPRSIRPIFCHRLIKTLVRHGHCHGKVAAAVVTADVHMFLGKTYNKSPLAVTTYLLFAVQFIPLTRFLMQSDISGLRSCSLLPLCKAWLDLLYSNTVHVRVLCLTGMADFCRQYFDIESRRTLFNSKIYCFLLEIIP